jgi:hypothetical protein
VDPLLEVGGGDLLGREPHACGEGAGGLAAASDEEVQAAAREMAQTMVGLITMPRTAIAALKRTGRLGAVKRETYERSVDGVDADHPALGAGMGDGPMDGRRDQHVLAVPGAVDR